MQIDAYTHFFPKKFFDKMQEVAGDYKDMGKRVRSLPALFDLEHRRDRFTTLTDDRASRDGLVQKATAGDRHGAPPFTCVRRSAVRRP